MKKNESLIIKDNNQSLTKINPFKQSLIVVNERDENKNNNNKLPKQYKDNYKEDDFKPPKHPPTGSSNPLSPKKRKQPYTPPQTKKGHIRDFEITD